MFLPPTSFFWEEGRAGEKDHGPYVPGAWDSGVILPVLAVGQGRGLGGAVSPAVKKPGLGAGDAPSSLVGPAGGEPVSERGSGPWPSAAETPDFVSASLSCPLRSLVP